MEEASSATEAGLRVSTEVLCGSKVDGKLVVLLGGGTAVDLWSVAVEWWREEWMVVAVSAALERRCDLDCVPVF